MFSVFILSLEHSIQFCMHTHNKESDLHEFYALSHHFPTFLLRKSTPTVAPRVPQVPHITVLISAKHGNTHFQKDLLIPCVSFTVKH